MMTFELSPLIGSKLSNSQLEEAQSSNQRQTQRIKISSAGDFSSQALARVQVSAGPDLAIA